jgi:hypothetical protein
MSEHPIEMREGQATSLRRWSPRLVAEIFATVLIAVGVIMLMQPFSLTLYGYSFIVTLAGTILFVVGSKLSD